MYGKQDQQAQYVDQYGRPVQQAQYVDQYGRPIQQQQQQQFAQPGYAQPAQQNYYPQESNTQPAENAEPAQATVVSGNEHDNTNNIAAVKPEESSAKGFRDWPFAILFILHLIAILVFMGVWGIKATFGGDGEDAFAGIDSKDAQRFGFLAVGLAVIAAVLSIVCLQLVVRFASTIITIALWFSFLLNVAMAILGFVVGSWIFGIIGLLFAAITFCYIRAVRDRIPFASANLTVAAAAIKSHCSLYPIAFSVMILQVAWIFVWTFAFIGIQAQISDSQSEKDAGRPKGSIPNGEQCTLSSSCKSGYCVRQSNSNLYQCGSAPLSTTSWISYVLLLVSLYWGAQVIKNVNHTTVAGTVSTWWFQSDSKGATGGALLRSLTTSFGSICLGSLIVAILQTLEQIARESANQGDGCACIAQCIIGCIRSLMEYLNKWAYVYVGIYGYKFTQAGKAVFELFKSRGFDAIINDDLISGALGFVSLAIGILCAGLGVAWFYIDKSNFGDIEEGALVLGIIGLFVGIAVSTVPFSVVDSAVATIFVCFAEDPAAFHQSNPELFELMNSAWYKMYPEIMVQSGYYA